MSYKIETFRQLMDEITYDWDCNYTLSKGTLDGSDYYYINKLTITPTQVFYKTDTHDLAPGLFSKIVVLYELLKEDK